MTTMTSSQITHWATAAGYRRLGAGAIVDARGAGVARTWKELAQLRRDELDSWVASRPAPTSTVVRGEAVAKRFAARTGPDGVLAPTETFYRWYKQVRHELVVRTDGGRSTFYLGDVAFATIGATVRAIKGKSRQGWAFWLDDVEGGKQAVRKDVAATLKTLPANAATAEHYRRYFCLGCLRDFTVHEAMTVTSCPLCGYGAADAPAEPKPVAVSEPVWAQIEAAASDESGAVAAAQAIVDAAATKKVRRAKKATAPAV